MTLMASDAVIVVLAAGKGTRLKSGLAKVLHRAGGRPLVEHVVRACQALGSTGFQPVRSGSSENRTGYKPVPPVVVVGHQAEDVRAAVEPLGPTTVVQEPQLGTGHAVMVAREAMGRAKYAVVLPGDAPLIRTETIASLVRAHTSGNAAVTILSALLDDPSGYGRIVRTPDGTVAAIVEEKALRADQRAIREINSSIYCFTLEKLWPVMSELKPANVHKELYLTDAIALLDQRGERVLAEIAPDSHEVLGCNTRADLAEVDRIFRARKRAALMDAGVTIYLPETVLIDADVEVGADTLIEPAVQLLGATRIGAGCTIKTGSVISDSVLEDGVTVKQHCVVANSRLGAGVAVGPFAHLRDGAELRAGARVGNYVEVKKSVLEEGVKAMHLTYLGDATVGKSSNIGAGTITCNYDGVRKNPTRIGERVFVGSGTELVAPVQVGDGAYIAAGSTITADVAADALAIARARQETKPGWAAARRAKLAGERRAPSAHEKAQPATTNPAAKRACANGRPRKRKLETRKPKFARRK
ncbi:MAG: bifunctional UDP-N-acetylglucosamine diphosphorylase/glucosamine-1-phosphate N-acetyltransferase GlmU [Candidatus Acidiferrales bacterium]